MNSNIYKKIGFINYNNIFILFILLIFNLSSSVLSETKEQIQTCSLTTFDNTSITEE